MLKRKSQFTALVEIDGEELVAHIPTTNRIGDVENKNLPCLLSYHVLTVSSERLNWEYPNLIS